MTETQGENGKRARRARPGTRVVAERYARALLQVALDKRTDLDAIAKELDGFTDLLDRESALRSALTSPTVASAKRVAILEAVLARTQLAPETLNLFRLLAKNERIPIVPFVAESYQQQVLAHRQIQPGEVVSAQELSSDQKKRLSAQLGMALGRTMELSYRTDPSILGGVVVRVGNRVFDASVETQLRRFKEEARSRL